MENLSLQKREKHPHYPWIFKDFHAKNFQERTACPV
jgi:hypothetical protein